MRYVIIKIDDRLDQNWKWIRRANGSTCWERRVRYTTSTIWHPLIVAMVRRRQSSALVDRVPAGDHGAFSTMWWEPGEAVGDFDGGSARQRHHGEAPCPLDAMAMAWRWRPGVCEHHLPRELVTLCVILDTTDPSNRYNNVYFSGRNFTLDTHSRWFVWSEPIHIANIRPNCIYVHIHLL